MHAKKKKKDCKMDEVLTRKFQEKIHSNRNKKKKNEKANSQIKDTSNEIYAFYRISGRRNRIVRFGVHGPIYVCSLFNVQND